MSAFGFFTFGPVPCLGFCKFAIYRKHANRDNGARLDIAAYGFWGLGRGRSYLDIWVFNPFTPANRKPSLASVYRKYEKEKKRSNNQRVTEIEHSSFSMLVFSLTRGMGKEATVFYKSLSQFLSTEVIHLMCPEILISLRSSSLFWLLFSC